MKIKNIKVGNEYKNHIELCKALEVEPSQGGKNRTLQKEDFKRFFDWETKGRRITIIKIYSKPKEKIDGRKGNSGKSEGSRGNNNAYMQHVDPLLTNYFQKLETRVSHVTINQLAEYVGAINSNYRKLERNKIDFFDYLLETKGLANMTALNNVFYSIYNIVNPLVASSLDRLVENGVITCDKGYIVHERVSEYDDETEARLADDREVAKIIEYEEVVLKELDIKKSDLHGDDKTRAEFYDAVNKMVLREFDYITMYYMGFEIEKSLDIEPITAGEVATHKKELNKVIKERVRARNVRRRSKSQEKCDEMGFGSPLLKWHEQDTLKEDYLTDTDIIIGYLLDTNPTEVKITRVVTPVRNYTKVVADTEREVETEVLEEVEQVEVFEVTDPTIWAFDVTKQPKEVAKEKTPTKWDWLYGDFVGGVSNSDDYITYSEDTGKYIFI